MHKTSHERLVLTALSVCVHLIGGCSNEGSTRVANSSLTPDQVLLESKQAYYSDDTRSLDFCMDAIKGRRQTILPELRRIALRSDNNTDRLFGLHMLAECENDTAITHELVKVAVSESDDIYRAAILNCINKINANNSNSMWVLNYKTTLLSLVDYKMPLTCDEVILSITNINEMAAIFVPDLIRIIEDGDAPLNARRLAVSALVDIAPNSTDVHAALRRALNDERIEYAARETIRRFPDHTKDSSALRNTAHHK